MDRARSSQCPHLGNRFPEKRDKFLLSRLCRALGMSFQEMGETLESPANEHNEMAEEARSFL